MDLLLQKPRRADPAFMANTLPLIEWATRVNTAAFNKNQATLNKHVGAWNAAMVNMADCKGNELDPWKNIKGPARACIATLGRIGWDVPVRNGWKIWIDRDGMCVST